MRVVNIRSFSNRAGHLAAIGDFSFVEAFFSGDLSGRWSGLFLSKASVFPHSRGGFSESQDLRILQTILSVFFATRLVAFLLEYDFVLQISDGSKNLSGLSTAHSPNKHVRLRPGGPCV